jgi:FkbM family methyltransferase
MRRILRPSDTGIDVGAAIGSILRPMVDIAPSGRHFAFEPIPARADMLRTTFPQVTVVAGALSDTSGTAPFGHVVSNASLSGLVPQGGGHLPAGPAFHEIEVPTMRLDDVLAPDQPVHFVKVDVEGAELLVFRGAHRTLARWRPVVVFEHRAFMALAYGHTSEDVYDFLTQSCGLRLNLMARWLRGLPPLDRPDFLRARLSSGYFLAGP